MLINYVYDFISWDIKTINVQTPNVYKKIYGKYGVSYLDFILPFTMYEIICIDNEQCRNIEGI